MHLAFDARIEIQCPFLAIAIRNDALARRYPGGVRGFLEHYPATSNMDLTVYHGLGFDFDEVAGEMTFWGIAKCRDYALVDAISYGWAVACGRVHKKRPHAVDLSVPWLKARYTDGGLWIRASASTARSLVQPARPVGAGALKRRGGSTGEKRRHRR